MKMKNCVFVAVLLIAAFLAGGYLAQSKALEKNWEQEAKDYAIKECSSYLYWHPDGIFNETAKRIYKDLTGNEYYRPESIYTWGDRVLHQRPMPTVPIPNPQRMNPAGLP